MQSSKPISLRSTVMGQAFLKHAKQGKDCPCLVCVGVRDNSRRKVEFLRGKGGK